MAEQMLTKEELEASKGATGRIVRIVGPVVDVEFPPDQLPAIYNALTVDAKTLAGDFVLFEVLGHTVDGLAVGTHELEELARHGVLEAVDARDTVADLDDGSDFARFDARIERIELLAQCLVNRLCGDFSH